LSISTDQLPYLEQAIQQYGDNPDDWVKAYLEWVK
jgi:hypothetical protein